MKRKKKTGKIFYFDAQNPHASADFGKTLRALLAQNAKQEDTIILLCIGTDRATGDCLGPLLGYKLRTSPEHFLIFGDLDAPVHAKNLKKTLEHIYSTYENPFIIAIDASLGTDRHVGYYTLGEGALKPGAGVDKDLPAVGHLFITGIVNSSGAFDQMLLQTTRLQIVMTLADNICRGLRIGLSEH